MIIKVKDKLIVTDQEHMFKIEGKYTKELISTISIEEAAKLLVPYFAHRERTKEEYERYMKVKRGTEIQKWLKDNDYKVNKRILGELTDEQWEEYKETRSTLLEEYNSMFPTP